MLTFLTSLAALGEDGRRHDVSRAVLPRMIAEGCHVPAYPSSGYRAGVGTVERLPPGADAAARAAEPAPAGARAGDAARRAVRAGVRLRDGVAAGEDVRASRDGVADLEAVCGACRRSLTGGQVPGESAGVILT